MGYDDVASGYPISIGFRRLTDYQRDPRDRGVTTMKGFSPMSLNLIN